MNLAEQFRIIFYSFLYGIFFFSTLHYFKKIKFGKIIIKLMIETIFFIAHTILFYFLLFKINSGMLSMYIVIFMMIGIIFCKVLYYPAKNDL